MCKKPNKNELAKIANHLLLSLRLLKTSPLNKSSSNIGAKTIRHHYLDNLQIIIDWQNHLILHPIQN